jgi:hypothetical protein
LRIYEGSPRQKFEDAFRALGAFLDSQYLREILVLETTEGFIVHGLSVTGATSSSWADSPGQITKENFLFIDEDVARLMEEGLRRRGSDDAPAETAVGDYYEQALRVIGHYLDEQKPRDVFFFEQDGAFVVRLLAGGLAGNRLKLIEFTRDDIAEMVARAPLNRQTTRVGARGSSRWPWNDRADTTGGSS